MASYQHPMELLGVTGQPETFGRPNIPFHQVIPQGPFLTQERLPTDPTAYTRPWGHLAGLGQPGDFSTAGWVVGMTVSIGFNALILYGILKVLGMRPPSWGKLLVAAMGMNVAIALKQIAVVSVATALTPES